MQIVADRHGDHGRASRFHALMQARRIERSGLVAGRGENLAGGSYNPELRARMPGCYGAPQAGVQTYQSELS